MEHSIIELNVENVISIMLVGALLWLGAALGAKLLGLAGVGSGSLSGLFGGTTSSLPGQAG